VGDFRHKVQVASSRKALTLTLNQPGPWAAGYVAEGEACMACYNMSWETGLQRIVIGDAQERGAAAVWGEGRAFLPRVC